MLGLENLIVSMRNSTTRTLIMEFIISMLTIKEKVGRMVKTRK